MNLAPPRAILLALCLGLVMVATGCGKRRASSETVSQLPSSATERASESASSTAEELSPTPTPVEETPPVPGAEATAPPPSEPAPSVMVEKRFTTRGRCHFALDAWELDGEAKRAIENLMASLPEGSIERIRLEGHCCEIGSAAYNEELGRKRAEAVAFQLHESHGIPLERLRRVSFGKRNPVTSNATESGRRKNRRCELAVITTRLVPAE